MKLYISTCDQNVFIVKYFQYFFNKYWSTDVNVKILGFNKPEFELEKNFEFISLGKEQVNGAKGWSNYIIDYFNSIEDEYFIFGIDDFMIARPVDLEVLETCKELMGSSIGRIDLQPSLQYARAPHQIEPYGIKNNIKFVSLCQKSPYENLYQNAGAFSIWNRKWFLKNIRKNWSPWDWETQGSALAAYDKFKVLGTLDRWAIRKLELLSNTAWPNIINVRGIREQDIKHMQTLSTEKDRVRKFEKVMDEKWYYNVQNWEQVIFGV